MPRSRPPDAPELRRQRVERVRAGRNPQEPARELEPTVQASATAWSKRSAMQGAAGMGRAPRSARRCVDCAERIGVCAKHEISWQQVRRAGERSSSEPFARRTPGYRSGDGAGEVDRFMRANQAESPIATMARVLGVSPSGDDAGRQRECSAREASDQALRTRIEAIHERSRGTAGAGDSPPRLGIPRETPIRTNSHEEHPNPPTARCSRVLAGAPGADRRGFRRIPPGPPPAREPRGDRRSGDPARAGAPAVCARRRCPES